VLEYCSPNIAKRLAFQHIRSTLLGNTLANIYDFLGYKVERINFVGDWGSQFARLLAAVEMWGDRALLSNDDMPAAMTHLFELYVRFHKELEQHPEYADRANQCLQRLEKGEPAASELWQQIRSLSVTTMEKTLARMHASFNHVEGESKYISKFQSTLIDVKNKAEAKLSDGAWIVEVEGLSTPALVQKRDGTTLYLTRDIAAAVDRFQRFSFQKMFYVVSEQQKLHFQLLFGVLRKMGCEWAERCEHVSFGTVLFGAEKMSTREGRVIFLDEVLNEARDRAMEECTKKNPSLKDKEKVAEQVGIGAIVFGELSSHRTRDIEFNWENVLALDGDTGPYVQYSLVRCYSLLEKANEPLIPKIPSPVSVPAYSFSPEEEQLVLELSKFRSVLHQATRENEPHLLTHYLIDLAKAFNRFYYRFPVLQATEPVQREVRLNLVKGTGMTLLSGLRLLGIDCPKEM
jgi:arginyl-tRNA synthetase